MLLAKLTNYLSVLAFSGFLMGTTICIGLAIGKGITTRDMIVFAGFLAGSRIYIALLARGKDITTGETKEIRRKKFALYARIWLIGTVTFIIVAAMAMLCNKILTS